MFLKINDWTNYNGEVKRMQEKKFRYLHLPEKGKSKPVHVSPTSSLDFIPSYFCWDYQV